MLDFNFIEAIIFIFPAFVANAAPVLLGRGSRFNAPIDGGRYWVDNRRILGDGKTIRGFSGGVLAFFFEYLDQSVKNPEDVKRFIKLPTLASIPMPSRNLLKWA